MSQPAIEVLLNYTFLPIPVAKFYLPLRVNGPFILLLSVVSFGLYAVGLPSSTCMRWVVFYFLNSKGGTRVLAYSITLMLIGISEGIMVIFAYLTLWVSTLVSFNYSSVLMVRHFAVSFFSLVLLSICYLSRSLYVVLVISLLVPAFFLRGSPSDGLFSMDSIWSRPKVSMSEFSSFWGSSIFVGMKILIYLSRYSLLNSSSSDIFKSKTENFFEPVSKFLKSTFIDYYSSFSLLYYLTF
jgi:hypothetical protein